MIEVSQCVAVCCSVLLQCVAVCCCSVLQCVVGKGIYKVCGAILKVCHQNSCLGNEI